MLEASVTSSRSSLSEGIRLQLFEADDADHPFARRGSGRRAMTPTPRPGPPRSLMAPGCPRPEPAEPQRRARSMTYVSQDPAPSESLAVQLIPSAMSYGNRRRWSPRRRARQTANRLEDLADPLADELDDRLEVELLGKRRPDLVDDRQLGVALPRLLDRAGARQGGGHVRRDEGQELQVLRAVRPVRPVALRHEGADRAAAGTRGAPTQPSEGAARWHRVAALVAARARAVGVHRSGRPVRSRYAVVPAPSSMPKGSHAFGSGISVSTSIDVERIVDQPALVVIERDVEVVGVHQLADDLVDRGVEVRHVARGARRLGNAIQRGLDLRGASGVGFTRLELRDPQAWQPPARMPFRSGVPADCGRAWGFLGLGNERRAGARRRYSAAPRVAASRPRDAVERFSARSTCADDVSLAARCPSGRTSIGPSSEGSTTIRSGSVVAATGASAAETSSTKDEPRQWRRRVGAPSRSTGRSATTAPSPSTIGEPP